MAQRGALRKSRRRHPAAVAVRIEPSHSESLLLFGPVSFVARQRVEPGQPVTAVLDAYPDWQIPAKVRTVIPTADRQKATVKVRISFLKLDPRILPDMGIKVTFLGSEPDKLTGVAPAALIPSGAVRDESGRKIVFLVKDNQLERRAVSVGNARGGDAEIMAGLVAGDTVVVKGPADLHDGEAIQIKK